MGENLVGSNPELPVSTVALNLTVDASPGFIQIVQVILCFQSYL